MDDLFDLGLDHALGADPAMRHAVDTCELTDLMLAYHAHLTRHGWACLVIGMRAPRGPHYLRLSERMIALLDELGAPDPLSAAYTLANFTLGSALTQPMAPSERAAPVDAEIAPAPLLKGEVRFVQTSVERSRWARSPAGGPRASAASPPPR